MSASPKPNKEAGQGAALDFQEHLANLEKLGPLPTLRCLKANHPLHRPATQTSPNSIQQHRNSLSGHCR